MKLRVSLTVLGVVVGTTAIVAMVTLGVGLRESVSGQFMAIGSINDLTVLPYNPNTRNQFDGFSKEIHIDERLMRKISGLDGVKSAMPRISVSNTSAKIKNYRIESVSIHAFTVDNPIKVSIGRIPRRDDEQSVIVSNKLTYSIDKVSEVSALELLNKRALLKIKRVNDEGAEEIRSVRVRVVGVAEERGAQEDYGSIYMPIGLAEDIWLWQENKPSLIKREGYDSLNVTVESPTKVDAVQRQLEDMGLYVFSMKQLLKGINTTFKILQAILGAIGAVALIVASIGIVNTMIMSIYERTREIGIMKAVGAGNKDIIKIFLSEAGAIGFAGGTGGTLLGWIISKTLSFLAAFYVQSAGGGSEATIAFTVPFWLAVFAIVFATVVGVVAGVYPALRAARLNPLVALRHE
jgi:putative ABC transport system permease protein